MDIWPEAWVLPFAIRPLGNLERQLHADEAARQWPFVRERLDRIGGRGGVPAAMNLTGATVFSPVQIGQEDWELILRDLAVPDLDS